MEQKPYGDIYVAKDKVTGKYVFIFTGMRYDQKRYKLMYSVSAKFVHETLESQFL